MESIRQLGKSAAGAVLKRKGRHDPQTLPNDGLSVSAPLESVRKPDFAAEPILVEPRTRRDCSPHLTALLDYLIRSVPLNAMHLQALSDEKPDEATLRAVTFAARKLSRAHDPLASEALKLLESWLDSGKLRIDGPPGAAPTGDEHTWPGQFTGLKTADLGSLFPRPATATLATKAGRIEVRDGRWVDHRSSAGGTGKLDLLRNARSDAELRVLTKSLASGERFDPGLLLEAPRRVSRFDHLRAETAFQYFGAIFPQIPKELHDDFYQQLARHASGDPAGRKLLEEQPEIAARLTRPFLMREEPFEPADFSLVKQLCRRPLPEDREFLAHVGAPLAGKLEPDPGNPRSDAIAVACHVLHASGKADLLRLPDLERPGASLGLSEGLWQRSLGLDPDYLTRDAGDLARLLAPHVPAVVEKLKDHPAPLTTPEGRLALAVGYTLELPETLGLVTKPVPPELEELANGVRLSEARRLTKLIGEPGQDAFALSEQADRLAQPHWDLSVRLEPMLAWARADRSRDHEGIRLLARGLVDPLMRSKAAAELVGHPELDAAGRYLRHQLTVEMLRDPEEMTAAERAQTYRVARTELTGLDEIRHSLVATSEEPAVELKRALEQSLGTEFAPLLKTFDAAALCEALGPVMPGGEHRALLEELGRQVGPENVLAVLPAAMAALDKGQEAAVQAGLAAHVTQARPASTGVCLTDAGVRIGGTLLKARTRS